MQSVIEALSLSEKRSLLASLMNRNHLQLQLSLTQERLWQLFQLQPDNAFYNFQTSLDLQGELSPKVLEIAALQVVLRHQVLQTSYGAEKGKPVLCLSPPKQLAIAMHDFSGLCKQEQDQRADALGMADVQRGFDLTRPPLFRLTLVRLAPRKHRLYLTMHHIVSDFLSLDLFLFELGAIYSDELTGQPCHLPVPTAGYQDFARMQRDPAAHGLDDVHLQYWRRTLAGAKPMEWFSDHVRPTTATRRAGTEFFNVPCALIHQIERFARGQQVTPFMVLLTGFNILLHACSGQNDVTVGSPMAGRLHSDHESLIGMFSYPVLMRTNVSRCQSFRCLLERVRAVVLEAAEHADVPLANVADCLGSQVAPLLRVMFSYVSRLRNLHFESLVVRRCPTDRGVTDLDLFITIYPDGDEWQGVLEYSADLFEQPMIRTLISAYVGILQAAVADPELSVEDLAAGVPVRVPARLAIAATFTADQLIEVFKFWSRELDLQFASTIAPYNQMYQQLIDPHGAFFSSGNALNVLLVRLEDWIRYTELDFEKQRLLQRSTQEFIAAAHDAITRVNCPFKIYLCPSSPGLAVPLARAVSACEQNIRDAFAGMNGVEVLGAECFAEMYSAGKIHDPQTDRAANIPYKPEFYVALGTQVVRQLRVQMSSRCKVLVLDCDNTLWQGLCAEDGAQGVIISDHHRALQRFVLQQAACGVLLCLISKNAPEHVLAVFRENAGMILAESDITAHRINWEPKSSNLESLARELHLGLDSFVFLDDDARECAEVSVRCPQVLSLQLPQNPVEFPRFIQNLWVFDRENLSAEDRQRTVFYRDNRRRELALRQSPSLGEFLSTLELRVDVQPAAPDQILRVAQLSQRTNQFNSSGLAFNQFELQRAMKQQLEVSSVEVRDRFGDYGLAGAVMYRKNAHSLAVEACYLSCRVLGRGVEYRILSELGRIAQASGLEQVCIHYRESPRNQPFRGFLDQFSGRRERAANGSCTFVLTVKDALAAKLVREDSMSSAAPESVTLPINPPATVRSLAALARLPHELSTVSRILNQINRSNSTRREVRIAQAFSAPQQGLESAIAAEWGSILRLDQVGRNDNFFELGGNSLLLVQLNGKLISGLGRDISITEMFQYPTVASLAGHLENQMLPGCGPATNARGSKGRFVLQDRKRQLAIQCSRTSVCQASGSG